MMRARTFGSLKKIGRESIGLVPVVVQDRRTRSVLMLAYVDRKAFNRTLRTGEGCFYSRSRKRLWRKGETSGHTQAVREVYIDCDADTLLLEVDQKGPACHTGKPTCFFTRISAATRSRSKRQGLGTPGSAILEQLFEVVEDRRVHPRKASYVSHLFAGGEDRVLKKVGEEAGEFLLASKGGNKRQAVHEAADLIFHLWVALNYRKISPEEVFSELASRFGRSGLDEKKRRRKR